MHVIRNLLSSPHFPEKGVGTPIRASFATVVVLSAIVTSAMALRLYSRICLKNEANTSLGVDLVWNEYNDSFVSVLYVGASTKSSSDDDDRSIRAEKVLRKVVVSVYQIDAS